MSSLRARGRNAPAGHAVLALTMLVALGCSRSPAPVAAAEPELIEALRTATRERLRTQTEAAWAEWTGLPRQVHAGAEPFALPDETLAALGAAVREAEGERRRALRRLHAFLVGERARAEGNGARLAETAARLGFADAPALIGYVQGFEVRAAGSLATQLLDASEGLFLTASADTDLSGAAPLAVSSSAEPAPPARTTELDALFPAERLLPSLRRTLAGMGIAWDQLPVRLDDATRAGKRPRAACFPVEVPGDVRIAVLPSGGSQDYAALFHEAGHALHFTHTRTPELEAQQLGDPTTSEAFAFLLESVTSEPAWLASELGIGEPELTRYVRRAALDRLVMVRRHARRTLTELERYATGVQTEVTPSGASATVGVALRADAQARDLATGDAWLYAGAYVRGWALAAQLRDVLRQRFGHAWWTSTDAGHHLRGLWASGQRLDGDELAREVGIPDIRGDALLAHVAQALARSDALAKSGAGTSATAGP